MLAFGVRLGRTRCEQEGSLPLARAVEQKHPVSSGKARTKSRSIGREPRINVFARSMPEGEEGENLKTSKVSKIFD